MELDEALKYAIRVARAMVKDQEADCLAGIAAWHAYTSFDPTRGLEWKRWVALCTRQTIYQWWRKLHRRGEKHLSALDQEQAEEASAKIAMLDEPPFDELSVNDRQLLHEHHVDRWPLDVIAKRRGITVYEAKKLVAAARARLAAALAK